MDLSSVSSATSLDSTSSEPEPSTFAPCGPTLSHSLDLMRLVQNIRHGKATDEEKQRAQKLVAEHVKNLSQSELDVIRENAEKARRLMKEEAEGKRPLPEWIDIPHFDEKDMRKWVSDRKRDCMALFETARSQKSSNLFQHPVHERSAPDYRNFIRNPQDLTSIRKLISSKHLLCNKELKKRITLMYANAAMYNEVDDFYWTVANDSVKYLAVRIRPFD
uniref:Bromo domain-containing protein n=1 Tax=Steinernema glaseri TaxID=37863 RepID=A0A1I7Z8F3_9BILA